MNEKMNGGISTMRGMFCRLPCQKGGITANPLRHKALAAASFLSTHDKKALKSQRFRGFCFFQYICEGHFCVLFLSYSRKNVFRRAKKPVRINT